MKVLMIEDDTTNLELMRLRMEHLGCRLVEATTAEEGLRLAAEERPDLVLVDLKLDGDEGAGLDVIRQLRANPATAGLTIVVHSVFVTHLVDLPKALPQVDGLLPKPFTTSQLQLVVEGCRTLQSSGPDHR